MSGDQPVLREMRKADLAFVYSSWLDSYRDGLLKHVSPEILPQVYFPGQRRVIANLLGRINAAGIVAAVPDADETILGWAVGEPGTLHYVYVKDAFRGIGLARRMVGGLDIEPQWMAYTHVTKRAREILDSHPGAHRFNPWLLVRTE